VVKRFAQICINFAEMKGSTEVPALKMTIREIGANCLICDSSWSYDAYVGKVFLQHLQFQGEFIHSFSWVIYSFGSFMHSLIWAIYVLIHAGHLCIQSFIIGSFMHPVIHHWVIYAFSHSSLGHLCIAFPRHHSNNSGINLGHAFIRYFMH